MIKYGYTRQVNTSFLEAIDDVDFALKEVGFGILTKIDLKSKLKEKLDKDIEQYMILGACNPELASEVLDKEYEIGLLLPCNIIVYSKGDKVFVSTILPTYAMEVVSNKDISIIAQKVEDKLKSVIDSL